MSIRVCSLFSINHKTNFLLLFIWISLKIKKQQIEVMTMSCCMSCSCCDSSGQTYSDKITRTADWRIDYDAFDLLHRANLVRREDRNLRILFAPAEIQPKGHAAAIVCNDPRFADRIRRLPAVLQNLPHYRVSKAALARLGSRDSIAWVYGFKNASLPCVIHGLPAEGVFDSEQEVFLKAIARIRYVMEKTIIPESDAIEALKKRGIAKEEEEGVYEYLDLSPGTPLPAGPKEALAARAFRQLPAGLKRLPQKVMPPDLLAKYRSDHLVTVLRIDGKGNPYVFHGYPALALCDDEFGESFSKEFATATREEFFREQGLLSPEAAAEHIAKSRAAASTAKAIVSHPPSTASPHPSSVAAAAAAPVTTKTTTTVASVAAAAAAAPAAPAKSSVVASVASRDYITFSLNSFMFDAESGRLAVAQGLMRLSVHGKDHQFRNDPLAPPARRSPATRDPRFQAVIASLPPVLQNLPQLRLSEALLAQGRGKPTIPYLRAGKDQLYMVHGIPSDIAKSGDEATMQPFTRGANEAVSNEECALSFGGHDVGKALVAAGLLENCPEGAFKWLPTTKPPQQFAPSVGANIVAMHQTLPPSLQTLPVVIFPSRIIAEYPDVNFVPYVMLFQEKLVVFLGLPVDKEIKAVVFERWQKEAAKMAAAKAAAKVAPKTAVVAAAASVTAPSSPTVESSTPAPSSAVALATLPAKPIAATETPPKATTAATTAASPPLTEAAATLASESDDDGKRSGQSTKALLAASTLSSTG